MLRDALEELSTAKAWRREVTKRIEDPNDNDKRLAKLFVSANGRVNHARTACELAQQTLNEANEALSQEVFNEAGLDPYADNFIAAVQLSLAAKNVKRK